MITIEGNHLGTNAIKINGETLIEVHYVPQLVDNAKQEELTRRIVEMLEGEKHGTA